MPVSNFFKPTREYYKYVIFNLLASSSSYTQREIGTKLNIAASTVNYLIDFYVTDGYIEKVSENSRDMKYILTKKGKEHAKLLNINYLSSTQKLYNAAKREMGVYLNEIIIKDYNKLIFYGAGEVCELLLNTIKEGFKDKIEVLAIVDDNTLKQETFLVNTPIKSIDVLKEIEHDAVLISSHTNQKEILNKLVTSGYDLDKVWYFFK